MKRPRRRASGWLVAVGFAAGGIYLLLGHEDRAATDPPPRSAPVSAATVTAGGVPIELAALARVQASNTVTVRAQVGGQIRSIDFADGQTVTAGSLLAEIDPRPLQATVDQDEANIARDQATLSNAEADLKRYVPLAGQGVVSAQQVATQRSLAAQLRGTVAGDLAVLSRDQVQLGYTRIRAPLSGVLGLRQVDVGNTVTPNDPTGIVVLTEVQPIKVLFPIPQADLPDVQLRQAAVTPNGLAVEAWTQDGSRKLGDGRLTAVSNQVDAASGAVTLEANFPNPERTLWPGASIVARLILETKPNGLTVPASALDQGSQGSFVWLIDPEGKVKPTPVQVKQIVNGTALLTGVGAGQKVVTDGQYGLTDGATVAVQTAKADNGNAMPLRSNQAGRLGIAP